MKVPLLGFAVLVACACGSHHGGEDDASVPDAAVADAGAPGDESPIVAPAATWTWVDFPGTKCGSGTPTGLGVYLQPDATELVLYLEGGGFCETGEECWGPSPGASNMAGFAQSDFQATAAAGFRSPLLVPTTAGNPFAGMSFVYVPYCTGDLHAGTVEKDLDVGGTIKPTYFWGANDLAAYLARLVPTFPKVTRVFLAGRSAGGFGTFLTYDRVATAFSGRRIDMVDDSGPPIEGNGKDGGGTGLTVWGPLAPAACGSCSTLRDVYDYDRAQQPSSRFAFMSFVEDTTISVDFGYSLTEYATVMQDFSTSLASDPNAKTYLFSNEESHVVESDPTLTTEYFPWLAELVSDSASWADATYP